jgi:single-strand DNA-binding protein
MNTLRNKVSLIGRLGAQPEVVKLESGIALTCFSIATNEPYKNKAGEWQDQTQWHEIKAWGKVGEIVSKLLKKGQEVAIDGRIVNKEYESKAGEKRFSTSIELKEFLLLTPVSDAKK